MGLTGALKEIAVKQCGHCRKEYGRHSKKQFMKCLYTANYNLYSVTLAYNKLLEGLNANKEKNVKKDNEEITEKVPQQ